MQRDYRTVYIQECKKMKKLYADKDMFATQGCQFKTYRKMYEKR